MDTLTLSKADCTVADNVFQVDLKRPHASKRARYELRTAHACFNNVKFLARSKADVLALPTAIFADMSDTTKLQFTGGFLTMIMHQDNANVQLQASGSGIQYVDFGQTKGMMGTGWHTMLVGSPTTTMGDANANGS